MNLLATCVALVLAQPATGIEFRAKANRVEVVAVIPEPVRQQRPLRPEEGEAWLRLRVIDPDSKRLGPPMIGSYESKTDTLTFRPRFALEPGVTYRAEFGPAAKPTAVKNYRLPDRIATAPPRVVKIYPTSAVLPANHLKFYIYFSQPMRGGSDIFKQFAIVDANGKEILDPWLHDEIWDEDDQCLILYIHPGRIKWGVLLRELMGPVLLPDRDYRLVINGGLLDAHGQTLGKETVKKFRTAAEDRRRIELSDWKLTAPVAGATEPLVVTIPKSVDHKSLERFVTIHDGAGKRCEGTTAIGKNEQTWSFTPKSAWASQEYTLRVDGKFEDVAGNTPRRPFDVDLRDTPPPEQRLHITFRPRMK